MKKMKKIIESLGWGVTDYGENIELQQYSPAGEDFFFTASKDDFVQDVIDYAEGFDADEHAKMWIENMYEVSGVPQTVRTLIDDADAIKKMLMDLAQELASYEKKEGA